ncbi:hypothetical protein DH2020_031111 [Rehmannia glutinosa]|uniref:Uncharacterized protein n=1 Tax=Rehmannia glutinosa TaxID=99300 RepID=A0ABR0VIZ1_REHGL
MAKNTSRMDTMETQLVEIVQNQSTFQATIQRQFEEMALRMEGFTQSVEEIIAKKMGEAIKEITSVAGKENINPNINVANTSVAQARARHDAGLLATPTTRANENVNFGSIGYCFMVEYISVVQPIEIYRGIKLFGAFMMEKVNRNHSEEYFVESFISGLKEEIKQMLELLQPKTLIDAMQLARKQESRVANTFRGYKAPTKFSAHTNPGAWKGGTSDGGGTTRTKPSF